MHTSSHGHRRHRREHHHRSSGSRSHRHSSSYHNSSKESIRIAFISNLFFGVLELIAGIYTGSLSMIAAAIHDMGDSISIGYAWWMKSAANYKLDSDTTARSYRLSLMLNYITAFILFIAVMSIFSEAYDRFMTPGNLLNTNGMLLFAVIGFLSNMWAVFRVRRTEDSQDKVMTRHLLEDTLQWLIVVASAIAIEIKGIPVLDLVLAVVIGCMIFINIFRNLRISVDIFLNANELVDHEKLENGLGLVPYIKEIVMMNVWLDENGNRVMAIQTVIEDVDNPETSQKARNAIRAAAKEFGIRQVIADFTSTEEL